MSSNRQTAISVGAAGQDCFEDTNAHEGTWGALVVIEDAVIENITITNATGASVYEGPTLSQGFTIWGNINNIELTSGKVAMYRR